MLFYKSFIVSHLAYMSLTHFEFVCVCLHGVRKCSKFIILHVSACMLSHFSHVQLSVTPWTVAHHAPLSLGFSRQGYWKGTGRSLQGIFPTQELHPRLLGLLHWQVGSLPLAPSGTPPPEHIRTPWPDWIIHTHKSYTPPPFQLVSLRLQLISPSPISLLNGQDWIAHSSLLQEAFFEPPKPGISVLPSHPLSGHVLP